MENRWSSSGFFSGLQTSEILHKIQKDLQDQNTLNLSVFFPRTNDFHVNVQWHRLDALRKFRKVYVEFRTSPESREEVLARTLVILLARKRWKSVRNVDPQTWRKTEFHRGRHGGTHQRSWTPQYSRTSSALSRGILISKGGRWTTHFDAHSSNTECLFRTIHSATQLSICGAVSSWCEEFAQRTLHTKKSGRWKSSWQKNVGSFWKCDAARSGFFGANSMEGQWGIWKQIARTTSEIETLEKEVQFTKVLWRCVVLEKSLHWDELQNRSWRGWWFWRSNLSLQRIHTLSPRSKFQNQCNDSRTNFKVLRVHCVLSLLKVIPWFVARFLTHFSSQFSSPSGLLLSLLFPSASSTLVSPQGGLLYGRTKPFRSRS